MNGNNYPLHPGQDHVTPYYVQVPQSEYESLKRENEQLHALLHDAPKQSATAEIDTLTSEVKALREMNVKAQQEIATLKDSQRWRKYPDEKPSEDTRYIICGSSGFRDADRWVYIPEKQRMGFGFHDYGVKYWMPMPKAPEDK